jgi:hypothetical protein
MNKEVAVSFKFPLQGRDGGIAFPSVQGKLVFSDSEGVVIEDSAGVERAIPHASIQDVQVTTRIERPNSGLVIPNNVRGGP